MNAPAAQTSTPAPLHERVEAIGLQLAETPAPAPTRGERAKALAHYMRSGFPNIQGWCDRDMVRLAALISAVQDVFNVEGGAAEIGVHHGKFFIPLSIIKAGGRHLVIDVFDDQEANVDRSGCGDRETFEANLAAYGALDDVTVLSKDSMRLGAPDILSIMTRIGPFSMFSIDGCHTVEHTYNDLLLAEQLVGRGGAIFVDDYYNPNWPGVQEAVCKYFMTHAYKFAPLCFGFNKLVLIDYGMHKRMLERFEHRFRAQDDWVVKRVKRFGFDGFSMRRPSQRQG